MRDLAKGRVYSEQQSKRKILLIVGVVVVSTLIGLFLMQGDTSINTPSNSAATLKDAPTNLMPVDVGEVQITGGVELATDTSSLKDMRYGGQAKATATRAHGGDIYVLNVDATMPDPINQKYWVWLVDSGGKTVPVNPMRGSKTHWTMTLRDRDKFSNYNKIWITLERTEDEKPEEHIMEGSF